MLRMPPGLETIADAHDARVLDALACGADARARDAPKV